ncbi:MAG: WD40/YVTN/BNR-like repeat-containing protein [Thermoanaerobaculia bacterium]
MHRGLRWALALLLMVSATAFAESHETDAETNLLQELKFRNIGPFRGGRSTAVAGVVDDQRTFYMGTTGGGVWKTTDGGIRWNNVSDKDFKAASIGAIAVSASDPNVIYVGTGSACPRGNVSPGIGVYRSTDAGKSWTHRGLEQAGQIGRIEVHPSDPDTVYVAALGHIFGPNEERGVYRSTDGGANWERVLFVSDRAGAVDLAMDPTNPRILFAATWRVERKPWTLESGGEGSGLHRSKDGGDTWEELTEGLPEGDLGKIGVSVSPANPNRVYALVEADKGGLYRSDNGGDRFRLINPDRLFRQRAWYYTHVYADPRDSETVWVLNTGLYRSHDGGKEFDFLRSPHGDQHDLWIHPEDSNVLINANDGGANVSYNGGRSWSTQANQPTAEMYRVSVDGQFPYRVYGCQQDNSCVSVPSRTSGGSIQRQDWWVIGGCESGHVAIDPRNPEITYSGCYGGQISRYDRATDHEREINLYPQVAVGQKAEDLRYRFQWNAPVRLSPHDPGTLYHTSQYVHRSTDEGHSWETISPDLSRNDVSKQAYAGGDLTWDNTGVEVYGTVFAFEESPHEAGVLWAGTDDGKLHISRDNGETWQDVTPAEMPEWGTVNTIDLSAHGPGRAHIAVHRYRQDDFNPYVFRTDDYGASWVHLTAPPAAEPRGRRSRRAQQAEESGDSGRIPTDHFVRVVREDPEVEGLLYAGTEFGLYASHDNGGSWRSLQLNLPVAPVTDLAVRHGDLVVATQGRSFWILDHLEPIHEMAAGFTGDEDHFYAPGDSYRFGGGFSFGGGGAAGQNPPGGVALYYHLAEALDGEDAPELKLEIADADGNVLRTLSSKKPEPRAPNPFARFLPPGALGGAGKLAAKEGMNRYVWNLRLPDAKLEKGSVLWGIARGPVVPPGTYTFTLSAGDWSATHSADVLANPLLATTQQDYEEQFAMAKNVLEALSESHKTLAKIRDAREQVKTLTARLEKAGHGDDLGDLAKSIQEGLTGLEERIYQTKSESSQDILNFPPMLDNQLLGLLGSIGGDSPPTAGASERFADLRDELDGVQADLQALLDGELAEYNGLVAAKELPAVLLP